MTTCATKFVGASRFQVLYQGLGLAFKLIDGLFLLGQGGLHFVKHGHLLLFQLLDVGLSSSLDLGVFVLLVHIRHSGGLVIHLAVVSGFLILLLALGVLIRSILHSLEMLRLLLTLEHAVVRVQEFVQIVA